MTQGSSSFSLDDSKNSDTSLQGLVVKIVQDNQFCVVFRSRISSPPFMSSRDNTRRTYLFLPSLLTTGINP